MFQLCYSSKALQFTSSAQLGEIVSSYDTIFETHLGKAEFLSLFSKLENSRAVSISKKLQKALDSTYKPCIKLLKKSHYLHFLIRHIVRVLLHLHMYLHFIIVVYTTPLIFPGTRRCPQPQCLLPAFNSNPHIFFLNLA